MGDPMRLALTALLGAALLALSAAPASAPAAARRASLLPSIGDPFKVRGRGFRGHERVRVTVTPANASRGRTRRVRASARGSFVLAFAGIEPCRGVRGVARGS